MNDYYDEPTETTQAVDDRLSLMQQYVDLDNHRTKMEHEQKYLDEKLAKIRSEQRKVRERIGNMLGFDDPMANAKASLKAEVEKLRADR